LYTIPVDVIKELTSYLDICCDDPAFYLYALTENERSAVVSYWHEKSIHTIENTEHVTTYKVNGKLHNFDDTPAVSWDYGSMFWYRNGVLHRDGDLPAVIYANVSTQWYRDGLLHRDGDLPAIITRHGHQEWRRHGAVITEEAILSQFFTCENYVNDL
jgi:hypothetical protein